MFESPKFTTRNVAKFAAKSMVSAVVAGAVKDVLITRFPATEKLKTAALIGGIAGWYVSDKLEPSTDGIIDFTMDEVEALAKKRHNKKIAS